LAHVFYEYLQKDIPEIGKVSISDVSASSVLIKLKVIFNRWVDTELIRTNPFKKVKLQTKTIKRDPLSIEEVKKLKSYDFSNEPKLAVYRDLFMFQIYTGLAYGDITDLGKRHVEILSNGDALLCKKRIKSSVDVRQFLIKDALGIIKKYENYFEVKIDSERILPKRHLNNMNESLKVIQAKVGITKSMSSHLSRHTTAQLIAECGIAYDVMDKMMGWSDRRQGTRAIYYRVSDTMLMEAKTKFENFIKQNI
jgi:integrase